MNAIPIEDRVRSQEARAVKALEILAELYTERAIENPNKVDTNWEFSREVVWKAIRTLNSNLYSPLG